MVAARLTSGQRHERKPERSNDAAGALFQFSGGLDGEPKGAMQRERNQRDKTADHRVPIKNAGMRAGLPVGPQRQKEVSVGLQRNAAQHVGQGCAEEDGEQRAGQTEEAVEQCAPDAHFDMVAQLNAYAAQDEQPKHDHQRQIKAAEGRGVEKRKGEVERAATGQQPDFVAIPNRANARKCGAALRFVADQKQVKHTHAEIEAVEHHVTRRSSQQPARTR